MSGFAPFAYLAILLVVAGAAFWLYRRGRQAERGASAVSSNEVKDEQLQSAADAPRNKSEVASRIREKGGF